MTIEKKSAAALGLIGVGFQLCYALLIDTPRLTGGLAVTLLCGALGFLPALAALFLLEKQYPHRDPEEVLLLAGGEVGRRLYYLLLALYLLVGAAMSAAALIDVATYIALSSLNRTWLHLATMASVCLCALCGCRAVAGVSRLRLFYLPLILLVIALVQYRSLVPRWLFPLLGDGAQAILREAVSLSGVSMLLIPLWLLSGSARSVAACHLKVTLFALIVALVYGMLTPAMPFAQHTRFFRLDTLLSNGRTSLSLQLPHMLVMYTGLLTGACYCLSMAARLLNRCFPAVQERWFVVLGALCVLGLLYTSLTSQENAWLVRALAWPAQLLPLWIMTLAGVLRRRRPRA